MKKQYDIQVPLSVYIQTFGLSILLFINLLSFNRIESSSYTINVLLWVISVLILTIIVIQLNIILTSAKVIEITTNSIKTKNIEVRISDIEKIIIEIDIWENNRYLGVIGKKIYEKKRGSIDW